MNPNPENPPQPRNLEGPLFLSGIGIWLAVAAGLLMLASVNMDQARAVAAGMGAELAGGREAGVPVGLAAGANPWFVWIGSFAQDLGTAFLSYPIFLYLVHRFHDKDWYIMRRIRDIEERAAEHHGYVSRWGPLGLGLFMLVPFLVNGPYIALVVGRLAGMRTRRMLAPVIAATIVTAGIWTFFFDRLITVLDALHPHIGWIIAGIAVAIVTILAFVDYVKDRRTHGHQPPAE